jgi:hypothetical protein
MFEISGIVNVITPAPKTISHNLVMPALLDLEHKPELTGNLTAECA